MVERRGSSTHRLTKISVTELALWILPPLSSLLLFFYSQSRQYPTLQHITARFVSTIHDGCMWIFASGDAPAPVFYSVEPSYIAPECTYASLVLAAAPFLLCSGGLLRGILRIAGFAIFVFTLNGLRIAIVDMRSFWGLSWWLAHDVVTFSFWFTAMSISIGGWVGHRRTLKAAKMTEC